jgi:hypothetical protein
LSYFHQPKWVVCIHPKHSIDRYSSHSYREDTRSRAYIRILHLEPTRASGVALAVPDSIELLPTTDMGRMHPSNAFNRQIQLAYARISKGKILGSIYLVQSTSNRLEIQESTRQPRTQLSYLRLPIWVVCIHSMHSSDRYSSHIVIGKILVRVAAYTRTIHLEPTRATGVVLAAPDSKQILPPTDMDLMHPFNAFRR